MAFDLSSAQEIPTQAGRFDLSSARPMEASLGDQVAAHPLVRFGMGLASPLIGAAQAGAHVGDFINEQMGVKPVVSPFIDNALKSYNEAKQRGMAAEGKQGFDVYGLLGSLAPAAKIAQGVSAALPAATSLTGRMGTGAAIGGTSAASMPVEHGGENFAMDKAGQIGVGAAVGSAAPLAAGVYQAGKAAIEPFYQAGRERIVGRALNEASGGQQAQVIQALQKAREIVPGSIPTVEQATGNAGLSAMTRSAQAVSPEVKVAYQARDVAQNNARNAVVREIAGDDNLMAQAIQARKAASEGALQQVKDSTAEVDPKRTVSLINRMIENAPGRTQLTGVLENVKKSLYEPNPVTERAKEAWGRLNDLIGKQSHGVNDDEVLRTARTVLDRAKKGTIDAEEALNQLKGLQSATPAAKQAIQDVRESLNAPDMKLRSNASQLYQGARKNITDLLNQKAGDGSKVNEAVSRELSVILKSLDHQINKAEPAYGKFMQAYSEGSKPINQMDVARAIEDRAVNKVTDVLQPNAYANALTDKTAQRATGFKRATLEGTMTPEQMGKLNAVKADLSRAVIGKNAGAARGSDTVQNLAYTNIIDQAGVPTWLRNLAPAQIAGNVMARGADAVYGRQNKEIANQLAMTLLDTKAAAKAMQAAQPSRFAPLIDALIRQASAAGGTAAGQVGGQ